MFFFKKSKGPIHSCRIAGWLEGSTSLFESSNSFKKTVAMQHVSSSLLSGVHANTGQESREQSETKYSFEIHRPAAAALSPD